MVEIEERLQAYWARVVAEHPVPDGHDVIAGVEASAPLLEYLGANEEADGWRRRGAEGRRRPGRVPPWALAAAAVAVLTIGAVLSNAMREPRSLGVSVADVPRALAVGYEFMDAWVSGDGVAAAASFTPEGQFDGVDADELIARHAWLRASAWQYRNGGCDVQQANEAPDVTVECRYTFENDLTRALDRDPVTGSFLLVIRDDRIASGSDDFNFDAYSDIWEGFLSWIATTHPQDAPRMHSADGTSPLLDAESIALWEAHTDEYVATITPYVDRARSICSQARASIPAGATGDEFAAGVVAAVRILREVPPPAPVQTQFNTSYRLLDRLAEAHASASTSARADIVENIKRRGLGLRDCALEPS